LIFVNWKGRFGNHLFQSSCANALSSKFQIPTSYIWSDILVQNKQTNNNKRNNSYIEVNNDNIEDIYNLQHIESDLVLNDYFQNKFCIDLFLKHNLYVNTYTKIEDSTFVHIRLGDIKNTVSLNYEYYETALNKFDNKKVILTSDSPEDKIVLNLKKKYDAEIINLNEIDTITMGANCKNRVLSLGTFSWWIGFLGSVFWGSEVKTVCPNTERTRKWHGDIFPIFDWKST
jgi:hypothetical protein